MKGSSVVETVLMLLIAGFAHAQDRGWYDVNAVDKSLADQLVEISQTGIPIELAFSWRNFDWSYPATHDVHGFFTPQEALCLALVGTPQVPVPLPESNGNFVVRRQSPDEPQHCEYGTVDWGPELIQPGAHTE